MCSVFYYRRAAPEIIISLTLTQQVLQLLVNQAARLQNLAKPGEILVNKRVAKMSEDDWYTFKDVTNALESEMKKLKGLCQSERDVFKLKHKYYDSK